jgi:RNA exonuclease 4
MDLANLSSNWKQLQKKLKTNPPSAANNANASPSQPPTSKRKRTDLEPRRPSHAAPRKKPRRDETLSQPHIKRPRHNKSKMNGTNPPTTTTTTTSTTSTTPTTLENAGLSPTVPAGKYVALDCEMVGVGPQLLPGGGTSMLARASLVNYHGTQLYDSYVLPTAPVTDWRTPISGIAPSHMKHARPFKEVQADVARLLKDRVLVGHSVRNDLEVLGLSHPRRDVRDTARYPVYRRLVGGGGSPRLRDLVSGLLGVRIQEGSHSSVEDARATMMLFQRDKEGFERENVKRWGPDRRVRVQQQEQEDGQQVVGENGRGEVEVDGEEGEEEERDEAERNGEAVAKKKSKKHKKKKKKK